MSRSEESVYITFGEQCIKSAVSMFEERSREDCIVASRIMENIVKVGTCLFVVTLLLLSPAFCQQITIAIMHA